MRDISNLNFVMDTFYLRKHCSVVKSQSDIQHKESETWKQKKRKDFATKDKNKQKSFCTNVIALFRNKGGRA